MSGPSHQSVRAARCPRCGYDLRGAMSGSSDWSVACPLEGRCAECGLGFSWTQVLNPLAGPPLWNVEYASRRRLPVAWALTIVTAFLGVPLWRRISMAREWRPRRLVGFALALPLLVVAAIAFDNAVRATRIWFLLRSPSSQLATFSPQVSTAVPRSAPPGSARPASPLVALLEALFLPLAAKSRTSILIDGMEHPYPAPITVIGAGNTRFLYTLNVSSPAVRGTWVRTGRVVGSDFDFIPRRVGGPWAPSGQPPITPSVGLASPFRALHHLGKATMLEQWPAVVGSQVLIAALVPLAFAPLPQTRRRCKVRWQHLARAGLYSLVVPAVVITVGLPLRVTFGDWLDVSRRMSLFNTGILSPYGLVIVATPLLLAAWWWIAARRYLQMPHAAAVGGSAVAIAALAVWTLLWGVTLRYLV